MVPLEVTDEEKDELLLSDNPSGFVGLTVEPLLHETKTIVAAIKVKK